MKKIQFRSGLFLLFSITFLLISWGMVLPSQAHWADLATAEITIGQTSTEMLLTIPTGLVAEADEDKNGNLSSTEIDRHQEQLTNLLGQKIQLVDRHNQRGVLQISTVPVTTSINSNNVSSNASSNVSSNTDARSSLNLVYSWKQAIEGVKIHYELFAPDAPAARCITTIHYGKTVKNVIFSPENREFSSLPNSPLNLSGGFWVTIVGAFLWGAAHAMSPGHGKTLVGAYLMGEKATARHALFLGLTTTITHTLGVFTLGGITLLASKAFLPEQLFPWMSLVSGLLVVAIGTNLLIKRLQKPTHFPHGQLLKNPREQNYSYHLSDRLINHPINHYYSDHHDHENDDQGHNYHSHNHLDLHSHRNTHPDINTDSNPNSHSNTTIHTPSDSSHNHSNASHIHATHSHSSHSHASDGHGSHSHASDNHGSHSHGSHTHGSHTHASHTHAHTHTHGSHSHSHLPPEDLAIGWRSLMALGISGGLIPCPSALFLLLSSIALGQVGYGLVLVLAFSLGLASLLTGLGLLLIYSKQLFIKLSIEKWIEKKASGLGWIMQLIPIGTAMIITFIGLVLSVQSLSEIGIIKFS